MWVKCHHCFCVVDVHFKGGVSDFWCPMLTFEITKTNTPLPRKDLAPMGSTSAQLPPYHLAFAITSADLAPSRFMIEKQRFPTSVACYDTTVVKLQTKNTYFTSELWILLTFKSSSSSHFHLKFLGKFCLPDKPPLGVSLLLFCSWFLFCFFIRPLYFLSSLGSANVRHVHWWAPLSSRPLLLIGYKFVLVLGPDSFSKAILKKCIPYLLMFLFLFFCLWLSN